MEFMVGFYPYKVLETYPHSISLLEVSLSSEQ